ncbi:MAG: radical SAM family heme chaperone HemW [Candidatus Dadabacteria bacterium]|nr:radical SAM family heme chaperone HemW [Candidatus Dadabacteria bacterium]
MKENIDKYQVPLGVYVHIPYCLTKCPYCDFNSYGTNGNFPEGDYVRALEREIENFRGIIEGREISTVFFGGGTPSLLKPRSIGMVMEKLASIASFSPKVEVSLEVNPRTADREKLVSLMRVGVNRISVGVQSFSQRKLDFYGRFTTPDDCVRALVDVRDAGFHNYNLDLIYGSSRESREEFEEDIRTALRFSPTHISAYCLTIEPGTEFATLWRKGKLSLPDDSVLVEFMRSAREILEAEGYGNYEVSNFARPGYECRHNLIYWNCHDYLGVGAGAHSHISCGGEEGWGIRWSNVRNPELYMKRVTGDGNAVCASYDLSRTTALEDKLLMGLRLSDGVGIEGLKKRFGCEPDASGLEYLESDGFILTDGDRLRLTAKGRVFTDELVARVCGVFH